MAAINMLDLAKRTGNDTAVGLIEEVQTYAPEVMAFPARTIRGTSYSIGSRTAYPGVGFRNANEGSAATKSTYEKKLVECYILSGIIQMDRAVADAYEDGPDAILSDESVGAMRQAMIELGSQVFYGTTVDSKGFPGLQEIHTTLNNGIVLDAGGTSAGTGSSVYGVKFGSQGCQMIFGSNTVLQMSEFRPQQVQDASSNWYCAYVSDMTAWVGLQVGSKYAVGRLKDATADTDKGVTDARLAELLSKYPIGYRPDVWFMSRRSAYQLQSARSSTVNATGVKSRTGVEVFAPLPTESNGIPIIITDSITDTETLS